MIAANPQTPSNRSGVRRGVNGWSLVVARLRGAGPLVSSVLIYLLFALSWSALGRRDADFARSAALVAACGAGATLFIAIQGLLDDSLPRASRFGWASLAVGSMAATTVAVAALYVVWIDGALFWRPQALQWIEAAGASGWLLGTLALLHDRPRVRAAVGEVVALLLIALAVSTLALTALALAIGDAGGRWSLLAASIQAALTSSALFIAMRSMRSNGDTCSGMAVGLSTAAWAWTAAPILIVAGGWSGAAGMVGLARWIAPIAALGVASAALNEERAHRDRSDAAALLPARLSAPAAQWGATLSLVVAAAVAEASGVRFGLDLILLCGVAVLVQIARLGIDLSAERQRVSVLLESTAHLERLANVDMLTELPNRAALEQRLAEEMERAIRYEQPLSICFVDIDRFKSVNDEYGHRAGDLVLRSVATSLQATVRSIDFVGRYGGEEFVVIAPGTWSVDALVLAERLRDHVERIDVSGVLGAPLPLSVSIGIAGFPEHADSLPGLLERADEALYHAKESGRNRVVLWGEMAHGE